MLNIDFVWAWFCSKHQQLRLPPSEPESAFWDNPSSCTPAPAPFFFGSDRNKWRCPREKSLLISIFWQATGCFKSSVKLLISEYYCSRTVSAIRSHQVVSYFCAEDSPFLTFHFSTRADYYDSLSPDHPDQSRKWEKLGIRIRPMRGIMRFLWVPASCKNRSLNLTQGSVFGLDVEIICILKQSHWVICLPIGALFGHRDSGPHFTALMNLWR